MDMLANTSKHQDRIMKVMDEINGWFGNGTIRISINDMVRTWAPKHENISPAYTSCWNEIPEVKC